MSQPFILKNSDIEKSVKLKENQEVHEILKNAILPPIKKKNYLRNMLRQYGAKLYYVVSYVFVKAENVRSFVRRK